MTRRSVLSVTGAALAAQGLRGAPAEKQGRIKQSVARWCYQRMSLEDLCANAARIGLQGIDLVDYKDWPVVKKNGLTPAMTPGAGDIKTCWNRKENHARLAGEMRENIERAAKENVPNVITFSGNRMGMSDAEGMDNCALGLNGVKKIAEDNGVTICFELLNSKIDHHDYMCDHTKWGVELMKRVDSPRVKLLYDIYHMQIMEGDIIRTVRDNFQYIGHFHTGGVPGRHEIDGTQELTYHAVAEAIADLKFGGFMAHEFIPVRDPMTSLKEAYELCVV